MHYKDGVWQTVVEQGEDPTYLGYYLRSIARGPGVAGVSSVPYAEQGLPNYKDSDDYVISIYMTSADEGWAVGGNSRKEKAQLWHYNDNYWSLVDSPAGSHLSSVYMTSPTEGWAVGYNTILHYTNGRWVDYFAEGN